MGLFDKLFKKKKPSISPEDAAKLLQLLQAQQAAFQQGAQNKERNTPISQEELMQIFAAYFAPNTDFYAVPGSEKFTAYFQVVNAATEEMQRNLPIFKAATKWTPEQLADLLNNPKPGITSSLICGLLFAMGDYAVIYNTVYCVDFCERIPNCIALYLLLTAQKQLSDKRKMAIDAGDGSNSEALRRAMDTLSVCDPAWTYSIF